MIRPRDALPAVVAIHRPEAPAYGCNRANADRAALRVDLLDVTQPAPRRSVAPIGKRVGEHLTGGEPVFFRLPQNTVEMLEHSVHAGVADNSHQMEPGPRPG